MDEMIGRLYDLQKLPLGLGVWEDPFLSWAREAETVWRVEQPALKLLVSVLGKPSEYCDWAAVKELERRDQNLET